MRCMDGNCGSFVDVVCFGNSIIDKSEAFCGMMEGLAPAVCLADLRDPLRLSVKSVRLRQAAPAQVGTETGGRQLGIYGGNTECAFDTAGHTKRHKGPTLGGQPIWLPVH